jgi:plasmid stability protein
VSRTLTTQIVVRVDDDLRAALEADAAANGRTVAQSVRFHLRRALAEREAA